MAKTGTHLTAKGGTSNNYTKIDLHWELIGHSSYKQHLELNIPRSCSLGPRERHLGGKQPANEQQGWRQGQS